ncbi:sulfide:quinone oxidoreductase [Tamilnaduibacter salinus]|uniref:Pyridine nucleotide-disulfide oxidoreductase n=1 Tax=Tamilnaduibacter salinus TaxID=1484056 RepID=A0A2A2I4D9_9GAMM|nr:FAD/NAD(P)-binding oxidoreductase [Tamilnaduibacter salinus]PAV26599.1 pyridine nucleotide-disulfide oxidoreductase [Tamilnaduibacter salinus]PVY75857.1 sulfide:quinone oxidoreductase [Tamilnaduibacter salinus]
MMTAEADRRTGVNHAHQIVVIGGGAAGIAVSASLLKRKSSLDIAIVDPATTHSYQPGWTMVGGGVFRPESTRKSMSGVIPSKATWYNVGAERVDPGRHEVVLSDGQRLAYERLVVAPGLALDWGAIEGLTETLGANGVTSNYRYDLAPYTWSLVQKLKGGTARFTQPPMPIKCAGAPQKAMYLSCDHWRRQGRLGDIDVAFHNTGAKLFGVDAYVPALQEYIDRYGIDLCFEEQLVGVDGPQQIARFRQLGVDGQPVVERSFDMLHVVPPQTAPGFIAQSGLGNESGWLDLEDDTLRHRHYPDIFGLGDASGTPNAKTAAAVRKQAPVVAENLMASLDDRPLEAAYLGYGSCPLTVERGRIVLAEFGYGGALQPSFPKWVNDGTKATRAAWFLKANQLPLLYWHGMLKGREWLASPARRSALKASQDNAQ